MALARVKVEHISRRDSGIIAVGSSATIQAWVLNENGTTGSAVALHDAATGGSSTTSAVNPDAAGVYQRWFPGPGRYKITETIDGGGGRDHYVSAINAASESAWTAATPLLNSWIIDGADPPKYRLFPEGYVVWVGHATRAVASSLAIFTLPAGYRPASIVRPPCAGGSCQIDTGGNVTPIVSGTDLRMDGYNWVVA